MNNRLAMHWTLWNFIKQNKTRWVDEQKEKKREQSTIQSNFELSTFKEKREREGGERNKREAKKILEQ